MAATETPRGAAKDGRDQNTRGRRGAAAKDGRDQNTRENEGEGK